MAGVPSELIASTTSSTYLNDCKTSAVLEISVSADQVHQMSPTFVADKDIAADFKLTHYQ